MLGTSGCIAGTDRDAVTLPVLKKEASELVCPFVVSWNRNVGGANSFEQLCVRQHSTERQENGLVLLPHRAEASLGLTARFAKYHQSHFWRGQKPAHPTLISRRHKCWILNAEFQ